MGCHNGEGTSVNKLILVFIYIFQYFSIFFSIFFNIFKSHQMCKGPQLYEIEKNLCNVQPCLKVEMLLCKIIYLQHEYTALYFDVVFRFSGPDTSTLLSLCFGKKNLGIG